MKFLIEANAFPEEQNEILRVLDEMRIEHTIWNPDGRPPYLAADNHVFFIGTIKNALALQRVGARFQIWLGKEFDYSFFGSHLNNLLNDRFLLVTYGQLLRNVFSDPEALKDHSQDYIRSNSGYKVFTGGLYSAPVAYVELEKANIFPEEILVAAEEKEISEEFRLVIRSQYDDISGLWFNKVVTQSSYPDYGAKLSDVQIKGIEADLDSGTYRPYPLWILDVAISKGEVKQLEANSINTSGLYQCDFKAIVNEILDIEKKEIQ
jgi:hypothetical protein